MQAKAIIQADILSRKFIQFYTYACSPAGGNGFKSICDGFREGLAVQKHNSAEEPVACYPKAVFSLEIKHIFSPESAADIASASILIGIALGRREEQIRGIVVEVKDVIGPKRQGVVRGGGEMQVVTGVNQQGLPVGIAAEESKVGSKNEVGIPARFGVNLVAAAILEKIEGRAGRYGFRGDSIGLESR